MRTLTCLALVAFLAALSGCAAKNKAAIVQAPAKSFVMEHNGRKVLALTAPADVESTSGDGSLVLKSNDLDAQIEFWIVPEAHSVDDGAEKVAEVIKGEFKNFKSTESIPVKISGVPAQRMAGVGNEADDGDPGYADLVVFKTGDRIFVACTHGEGIDPKAQAWMLSVVLTAKVP